MHLGMTQHSLFNAFTCTENLLLYFCEVGLFLFKTSKSSGQLIFLLDYFVVRSLHCSAYSFKASILMCHDWSHRFVCSHFRKCSLKGPLFFVVPVSSTNIRSLRTTVAAKLSIFSCRNAILLRSCSKRRSSIRTTRATKSSASHSHLNKTWFSHALVRATFLRVIGHVSLCIWHFCINWYQIRGTAASQALLCKPAACKKLSVSCDVNNKKKWILLNF